MTRASLSVAFGILLFLQGCSTTSQVTQVADPKKPEAIEYTSASDGRPFLDRYPAIGVPVSAVMALGEVTLVATWVTAVIVAACYNRSFPSFDGATEKDWIPFNWF